MVVFRARNWQIFLVYGFLCAVLCLMLVSKFRKLQVASDAWDFVISVLELGLISGYLGYYCWSICRRFGTRIEVGGGFIRKMSFRGKVLFSDRIEHISKLGFRQSFFGTATSLTIAFSNSRSIKIDAEYENFRRLVKVLEERSGKSSASIKLELNT